MKKNFNELFSKMKPEAQERVKARASELLQAMALADLRQAHTNTQQQLVRRSSRIKRGSLGPSGKR